MSKAPKKNVVSATDRALLRERYEFVSSRIDPEDSTWVDRMVQRYNDGLYKEYALADLSRPGQLGLRWRTKVEVANGRGEYSCGNKSCLREDDLVAIEVPFRYQERGELKKELVKLRLCPKCLPLVNAKKKVDSKPQRQERERSSLDRLDEVSEGSYTSESDSTRDREEKRKRNKRPHKKHRKRRRR